MTDELPSEYLRIIKQHFPDIKNDAIRSLTAGKAHEVFVVQDIVFRFPCDELLAAKDAIEEQFFRSFTKISPVAFPQIRRHSDRLSGITYQTYPYIPGVPLTKERAALLPEKVLRSIAEDIGRFLTTLHSFPVKEAEKFGIDSVGDAKNYGEYFKKILPVDKSVLSPLLSPEEWQWIAENIAMFYELTRKHPFPLSVTHSDLLPEHILIDEKTQTLSGIIDFSLRISDAAHDFKYFDRYGALFLQTVYEQYLPVDFSFEKRREFHARDLPVGAAYLALVSDVTKEEQEKSLSELKEYILTHPVIHVVLP